MLFGFTFYQIAAYFLAYSFLGWCVEVVYHVLTMGKIINRGFLNGPVCPIYGFGMLLILTLLLPLQEYPFVMFLGGVCIPSSIELFAGWAMFKLYHARWWDYRDEPFNLGGYICLRFSILWGIGTMIMVNTIHPLVALFISLIPHTLGIVLIVFFFAVYAVDLAATAVTAAGLSRDLATLERMANSIHSVSDSITDALGTRTLNSTQRLDEQRLQLKLAAAEARTLAEEKQLSSRELAARACAQAEAAMESARHYSDLSRLNASEAAHAVQLAAQGKMDDMLDSLLSHRAELTIRTHTLYHRLWHSSAIFGAKRMINACPEMRYGTDGKLVAELLQELEAAERAERETSEEMQTAE